MAIHNDGNAKLSTSTGARLSPGRVTGLSQSVSKTLVTLIIRYQERAYSDADTASEAETFVSDREVATPLEGVRTIPQSSNHDYA